MATSNKPFMSTWQDRVWVSADLYLQNLTGLDAMHLKDTKIATRILMV